MGAFTHLTKMDITIWFVNPNVAADTNIPLDIRSAGTAATKKAIGSMILDSGTEGAALFAFIEVFNFSTLPVLSRFL